MTLTPNPCLRALPPNAFAVATASSQLHPPCQTMIPRADCRLSPQRYPCHGAPLASPCLSLPLIARALKRCCFCAPPPQLTAIAAIPPPHLPRLPPSTVTPSSPLPPPTASLLSSPYPLQMRQRLRRCIGHHHHPPPLPLPPQAPPLSSFSLPKMAQ